MNSIEKVVELLKKNAQGDSAATSVSSDDENQISNIAEVKTNQDTLIVDLPRFHEHGIITPESLDAVKAEEFRILKRPVLRKAFDKEKGDAQIPNSNMIMVTSSLPEEGKTFTSLSLAMSIAIERDTTVLLVDCDVVNPSLSRFMQIEKNLGLTDFLLDSRLKLSDIIINTDIPRLKLLPAGTMHSQSTELLASERMANLMDELSERYSDRIVLFDSPPILLANQATVLSQLVGQIIVVVEAENTPQHVVKEAVELLDAEKAIGMVLNKTRKVSSGGYYGAYYGPSEV